MAKRNDGKDLENKLNEALVEHQAKFKSHFFRLYDATSSGGGRGHRQDGDFIWLAPADTVLLECKSTEVRTPLLQLLKGSKTSKNQIAKHSLWHIAGRKTVYVYADLITQEVIAYCGYSVLAAVRAPARKPVALVTIGARSLRSIGSLLLDIETYLKGERV